MTRTPWLIGITLAAIAALGTGCTASRTLSDAGIDAPFVIELDSGPPFDGGVDARPACEPGEIDCGGTCTRVAGDSNNCGSCGNVCPAGSSCAVGRCDCYEPMLGCDGICTDPFADPENCGSCGHVCAPTETCSMGECIISCTEADHRVCVNRDESGAPMQICADLLNDPLNCGACNTRCAGGSTCVMGRCACPTGFLACSGMCTDVSSDPANCGACRNSCGTGGTCAGSMCTSCGTDRTMCSGRCIDTMTDRLNCGSCARSCGTGEACSGGLCECATGLMDCGSGCTNPLTDVNNCGGCGITCGPGGVCSGGACTCATGLTMCGASCRNTQTDVANCGGCGNACPPLVGGVCSGGMCGCPGALFDCGGTCVDRSSDRNNCGSCGTLCGAGEVCYLGACTTAPPTRYMQTTPPAGTVSFIDACAAPGHTTVLPTVDDSATTVTLPFPFRYWATNLVMGAAVNVSSNGFMSMDGVFASALSGTVPSASTPNAVIAPHWGDDYTRSTGICVATVGTAPNRQWVVEWADTHYCCTPGTTHLTYEVILTEGSNTIDFVYQTMDGARSQTMGIENQTGTMGINACPGGTGSCTPTAGQIIRFLPIP